MPKKYVKPPKDVIREWPEIFEDIYMSSMPIKYIHGVEILFDNGRVWGIDLNERLEFDSEDEIIEKLMGALKDYHEEIQTINFQVDVARLKEDVINSTKGLLGDS